MAEQPDDLSRRVENLESQVGDLRRQAELFRHDAAAARILAGGADRDVAEIRTEIRDFRKATTASFNALRADFTDLRSDFTDLQGRVSVLESKMDNGFLEMRGRLDTTAAGIAEIARMLTMLINDRNENSG